MCAAQSAVHVVCYVVRHTLVSPWRALPRGVTRPLCLRPQYKTEKDGVVETRVEQKITIQSDGDPIDHDAALREAIQEATDMNPDMTVEKIEIQQQSTNPPAS